MTKAIIFVKFGAYLVLDLVSVAVCSWVFWFLYLRSKEVFERKQRQTQRAAAVGRKKRDDSEFVLCPCLFGALSTAEFTMAITVTCVALFAACSLVQCALIALILVIGSTNGSDHRSAFRSVHWLVAVWGVLYSVAFALMLVTHFERLRLTFKNTVHRLPKCAPKALYAVCAFVALTRTLSIFALFQKQMLVWAICLLLLVLLYFASVSVLIGTFFKKTVAVAKAMHRPDDDLMNVAIRVTLCATMSLVTSTIVFVVSIAIAMIYPKITVFGELILCLDPCFNAFCLMCTLRRAERHYTRVFGAMHALLAHCLEATDSVQSQTADYLPPASIDSQL